KYLHKSALLSRHPGTDGFHRRRIVADHLTFWLFYRSGDGVANGIRVCAVRANLADRRRGLDCAGERAGTSIRGITGNGPVCYGDRVRAGVDGGYGTSG